MLKNLLIWLVAVALSIGTGVTALGAIAKNKTPELGLSLFPKNGFAAETAAADLTKASIAKNAGKFPNAIRSGWNILALKAFYSEPVVPDAIAVIALSHTEDVRAELMRKAFELSRRQQLVNGWLIADSVNRDDISALLTYYDTSMRTSNSVTEVVIPVMAAALADENFVKPFESILNDNPPWARRFWRQVVISPESVVNAADLRQKLHDPEEPTGVYQDTALIAALIQGDQFGRAEQLYEKLSPQKKDVGLIRNSEFVFPSLYAPFDWQLFSTGEYGAVIDEGSLNLSAVRSAGGLFARQLVRLPDSLLNLEVTLADELPKDAIFSLELSCAERVDNRPATVKISLDRKMVVRKISNQLSACEFYWLNILGRSSEFGDGFDVTIDSIKLRAG
ncbi:MAG: hypothetical protein ABJP02_18605 [Parasphingorhabdus sp.]|uniref:hypothetical protein n=1 Tax=Parasphingorhabdus sp. TaxID=2709688 RepID=UPI0032993B17